MNNKKLLMGGLAIVGAIALVMYLKPKPRKNSDGFFGANGKMSRSSSGNCEVCYDNYSANNSSQSLYYANNGYCKQGDRCKRSVKITQA